VAFVLQSDLLPPFDGYPELLAVAGFALGVPAGMIGLHRPRTAAFLLGMIALTPLLAVAVADAVVVDRAYGLSRPPTSAVLSAAAQLLTAALFLLAWRLGHSGATPAAASSGQSSAQPSAQPSVQADRSGDGGDRLLERRS
jgi:hypothetical protein